MSNTKRSRTTQLTSRISEFNPQVTLFEPAALEESPRRSKRVKTEVKSEAVIVDLEDLKFVPKTPKKSASQTLKTDVGAGSMTSTPKATNAKRPKKVKSAPKALAEPPPPPPNWRETYDIIKEMRSRFEAPVDTMGCQRAQMEESDPRNQRYSTLVSLMLSSQTTDIVQFAAMAKLRTALGGSISIEAMIAAPAEVISEAIASVGYWRKKTVYLQAAAKKLRDEFNSDVPNTADELCSLPGVGPKMAYLTLQIAWNKYDGIGVDVHVHRITNLLGWHDPPTTTPEDTRRNLQSWLPQELYGDINHMMVGFGQVICVSSSPRCDVCDLSTKGRCPSARTVTSKKRKAIVFSKAKESPPKVEITLEAEERKFIPNA